MLHEEVRRRVSLCPCQRTMLPLAKERTSERVVKRCVCDHAVTLRYRVSPGGLVNVTQQQQGREAHWASAYPLVFKCVCVCVVTQLSSVVVSSVSRLCCSS